MAENGSRGEKRGRGVEMCERDERLMTGEVVQENESLVMKRRTGSICCRRVFDAGVSVCLSFHNHERQQLLGCRERQLLCLLP